MNRHPEVKWAQREDRVFITVQLPDAKDAKVNLEPEGVFSFSASGGADNHPYELKLELHDKVNVEESKVNVGPRSIFCILEKSEPGWWKKLLRGDVKAPHYVKVDWDKWVDEDEDTGTGSGPGDLDMGGMDLSSLGGMGGMGGMDMSGMGGMGGMGMGGMGMGGMGGMSGMDMSSMGMGGMDDDSDDEDEVAKPDTEDVEKTGTDEAAEEGAGVSVAGTEEDKK